MYLQNGKEWRTRVYVRMNARGGEKEVQRDCVFSVIGEKSSRLQIVDTRVKYLSSAN